MNGKHIDKSIFNDALRQSFVKLSPRVQLKNPVMLVVYIGAIFTTFLYILSFMGIKDENSWYTLAIALILWFTVLFANFAESIAEGRGRAQADSLRSAKKDVKAKKLKSATNIDEY
ncbi:potassium-transporting ATPase subunit B, partial [Neobacillus drentensis]